MKKNRIFGFAALILSAIMIIGAALSASAAGTLSTSQIDAIVSTATDATQVQSPFTAAVSSVRSSVVMVNNYAITTSYNFNYYGRGGDNQTQRETLAGTGSGVVISEYGHILTNFHVVEDASRVTVYDGENELEATVVKYDETLDIAVLLCPDIKLPAAPLGDSDQLQVGEWAIVIGNPLGEDFFRSTTVGVVSSLEREVESASTDKYGRRTTIKNSMIQVDAAINSGNSGGGMFNTLGQLMGIPSMKYSSSFFSSTTIDNIGMCIPINAAKPLIREALSEYNAEEVREQQAKADTETQGTTTQGIAADKPRLGVTVTTLTSSNSAVAQGVLPNGAFVKSVEAGSPAEAAGIQAGDIIVELDGAVIANSSELVTAVEGHSEGDQLMVKVFRAENVLTAQFISEIGEGTYIDMTVTLKVIEAPAA